MVITAVTPVREIVVETPTAIPVLEQFGIDYSCGGAHTLAEACTRRDQNVASVLDELQRQQQNPSPRSVDWRTIPLSELISYIVQNHHTFTRQQLGLIRELAAKVERRHGRMHPEIYKMNEALAVIGAELAHHFPAKRMCCFPILSNWAGTKDL